MCTTVVCVIETELSRKGGDRVLGGSDGSTELGPDVLLPTLEIVAGDQIPASADVRIDLPGGETFIRATLLGDEVADEFGSALDLAGGFTDGEVVGLFGGWWRLCFALGGDSPPFVKVQL